MRLTVDLINQSLSYLNPLKERELDLRGNKIPAIENLGGAQDHDSIDFTDNDIPVIAGFPSMPRLHTLLLARNRVAVIAAGLERSIPNLSTLVLENNRVSELADLDPLMHFPKLEHVVLRGNPVCRKDNYRSWVLWRAPSVRYLDYVKVKDAERTRAMELFGTHDEPTSVAKKIASVRSREAENPDAFITMTASSSDAGNANANNFTPEQRQQLEHLIRNAKTLNDMTKLENAMKEGRMPAGMQTRR